MTETVAGAAGAAPLETWWIHGPVARTCRSAMQLTAWPRSVHEYPLPVLPDSPTSSAQAFRRVDQDVWTRRCLLNCRGRSDRSRHWGVPYSASRPPLPRLLSCSGSCKARGFGVQESGRDVGVVDGHDEHLPVVQVEADAGTGAQDHGGTVA